VLGDLGHPFPGQRGFDHPQRDHVRLGHGGR
jgi:hypothetical protein